MPPPPQQQQQQQQQQGQYWWQKLQQIEWQKQQQEQQQEQWRQQEQQRLAAAQTEAQAPAATAATAAAVSEKAAAQASLSASSMHVDLAEIELGQCIGRGAFGIVHRARWRGSDVAVKQLLACAQQPLAASAADHADNADAGVADFEAEVAMMAALRHPNVCLFMGCCLTPPTRAIVTEFVPRGSLWDLLRDGDPATVAALALPAAPLRMAADAARGCAYLHASEVVHRDLKSANLLVTDDLRVKVADFGLARVKARAQTMTGQMGTMQWMAPEVLSSCRYTEKADVYSFGIILWELLARGCPYEEVEEQGVTQIAAALAVLRDGLRPRLPMPREARPCPGIPLAFEELMQRCWAAEPQLRPPFADALVELEAMLRRL